MFPQNHSLLRLLSAAKKYNDKYIDESSQNKF